MCTPSMPITQQKVKVPPGWLSPAWLALTTALPSTAAGTVPQATRQLWAGVPGGTGCRRAHSARCLAEEPGCPCRFCGSLALAC